MTRPIRRAAPILALAALGTWLAACSSPPAHGPGEPTTPAPAPVARGADEPVADESGPGAEGEPDSGEGDGDEPEPPERPARPEPEPTPPGAMRPSPGGAAPDLPDAWTACSSDAECVGVELECCDHCNGGTLVAVHRDQAEATRKQHGPAPGSCQGVACTMRACFGPDPACEQGQCTLVQGQGPAMAPRP